MRSRLILYLILPLALCQQKCLNNSTYMEKQDFCVCTPQFIGQTCNVTAYQLNQTEFTIPLNKNYTFAYFQPQQKVIYRILLTFCSANKSQQIDFTVFVQEEQKNGKLQSMPKKTRDTLEITVGGTQGCKQVLSTVLVSIDKKPNDEIVRIIFGFQLTNKSISQNSSLVVKCETNSIFTVSFLGTILISFVVIISVFLIFSLLFLLRRRWLERHKKQQQKEKRMECINAIMPSRKYQTLNQELTGQFDLTCSICLGQFQKNQQVRKTPCGHIYHSSCLDSWCNSNLNCPICRQNFQKQQQLRAVQQSLQPDNTNIRQPIL